METSGRHEYVVVVNDEEQYSLWRAGRPCPDGWRSVGVRGAEEKCVEWIETNWTDLRPRSLRVRMESR